MNLEDYVSRYLLYLFKYGISYSYTMEAQE